MKSTSLLATSFIRFTFAILIATFYQACKPSGGSFFSPAADKNTDAGNCTSFAKELKDLKQKCFTEKSQMETSMVECEQKKTLCIAETQKRVQRLHSKVNFCSPRENGLPKDQPKKDVDRSSASFYINQLEHKIKESEKMMLIAHQQLEKIEKDLILTEKDKLKQQRKLTKQEHQFLKLNPNSPRYTQEQKEYNTISKKFQDTSTRYAATVREYGELRAKEASTQKAYVESVHKLLDALRS